MEILRCKARLSVLWLTMAIGTAVGGLFSILKPGGIEEIMAGKMGAMELSEGTMVIYLFFFLISMLVAILCLTLNVSANRWLSFIVGILWILWFIFDIINATMIGAVPIAMWLLMAIGLVVSAFIVYFAWNLPKQEA